MNKKIRTAVMISILIFCFFMGCGRKEKQQEELLLLPVNEESADEAVSGVMEAAGQPADEDAGEHTMKAGCVIHICGAVENPGVYILEEDERIYQAVERAGGFCEDADENYLNLADSLTDGMKIYVPTREEVAQSGENSSWQEVYSETALQAENSLININTAGEELLCTLPGVGSSKAKSIIAYREKNGAFQKIEDIMNVDGIKDGLFQKIKDCITV